MSYRLCGRLRIDSGLDETGRMKTFHCTHCQNLIFFENVRCLSCGHALAFLPDLGIMAALSEGPDGLWRAQIEKSPWLPAVCELRSSERLQLGDPRRGGR